MSQTTERGIVTPEAVRLDFEDASVGSRAVAIAIDWGIQAATLLVVSVAAGLVLDRAGAGLPAWGVTTIIVLLSFVVLFGYPVAFETFMRGRTPGKTAMGLRVVTVEGAPVGFRHAALRAALGLVDFGVTSGFLAVITVLLSRRSQRVGDHVAGTVVVRERTGASPAAAATFAVPRGLEGYASTVDTTALRRDDYLAVRAFLLRAEDLPADRRAAIGRRLADGVAARLAHRIPAEIPPEAFLRTVAARHQARRAGVRPDGTSSAPTAWAAARGGARPEAVRPAPVPPVPSATGAPPAPRPAPSSGPSDDREPPEREGERGQDSEGAGGGFVAPS